MVHLVSVVRQYLVAPHSPSVTITLSWLPDPIFTSYPNYRTPSLDSACPSVVEYYTSTILSSSPCNTMTIIIAIFSSINSLFCVMKGIVSTQTGSEAERPLGLLGGPKASSKIPHDSQRFSIPRFIIQHTRRAHHQIHDRATQVIKHTKKYN